jgi:hypothetical protein
MIRAVVMVLFPKNQQANLPLYQPPSALLQAASAKEWNGL